MNVETLISIVVKTPIKTNNWESNIFISFYDQIFIIQQAFTDKQATLAVKLLTRYKKQLCQTLNQDISVFLQPPVFKMPLRKNSLARKISVISDQNLNRVFRIEFPYDETLVALFRSQKSRTSNYVQWSGQDKSWILSLSEKNLKFLMDIRHEHAFEVDEKFMELEQHAREILENTENHVPMLCWDDTGFKVHNIGLTADMSHIKDPISAVFEARKYGITVWDTKIEEYLSSSNLNSLTLNLLKTDPAEAVEIQGASSDLNILQDVIERLSPCLFVIPGGDELAKSRALVSFLETMGITTENISVLFRLNSDKNADFNVFVKDNGLNNPITEKTRAVFISQRFPKTILQSQIKFGCIICLGTAIVHYLIKDYLQNHENVIYFSQKSSQGILNFAKL